MSLREAIRPYYLRWLYFRLFPQNYPPHWKACWKYRWSADATLVCTEDRNQPRNDCSTDWVFLPMVDWHTRLQRPQQLAKALAQQGDRIFYLNINLGRQYTETPLLSRRPRVGKLADRIYELHVALPAEPVFHERVFTEDETRQLSDTLRSLLHDMNVTHPIILWSLPTWNGIVHSLGRAFHATLIYDCHDWLRGLPNMGSSIVSCEPEAFQLAEVVLFSSNTLRDVHVKHDVNLRDKSVLLSNGVAQWSVVPDTTVGGLVVGFVGAFERWVDWSCLELAAKELPHVTFLVAGSGPCPPNKAFQARPNVQMLGEVDNDRVGDVLARCIAAVIPFHWDDVVTYADPIKLYEYFFYGLPVVHTGLHLDKAIETLTYPVRNSDDFGKTVRQALGEKDPALREARKQEARRSTWSARSKVLKVHATRIHHARLNTASE